MRRRRILAVALGAAGLAVGMAGCGATRAPARKVTAVHPLRRASARGDRTRARRDGARRRTPAPIALVTAQTENQLLMVSLPGGRVIGRVPVPGEPGYVAALGPGGPVAVVSAQPGAVTLLGGAHLSGRRVLRGLVSPHIPAMAPGGDYAYITDDASGRLVAVELVHRRVASSTDVGAGAHHLAFSPNAQRVWVALGQAAGTIVILSTVVSTPPPPSSPIVNVGHPHVVGRFAPGYLAHDLLFTPDGRRVWITAADRPYVGVFSARSHRLLFRVPAGAPPQHVVFAGRYAYVTSGYGQMIERVALSTGRVVHRAHAPYGSFDLDAAGRYVVTSSLLRGTLAIYDRNLRLLRVRRVASSAEDVAIYRP
ncbi:MAG: YncE family protein [Solirubrobacteraceae bacterium]